MKKLILLSVLMLVALVSGSAQGPALYVNPALTVGRIIVPSNIISSWHDISTGCRSPAILRERSRRE